MSSGESELYSLTEGVAQTLGLLALAADMGMTRNGRVHTDASATICIISRQGLGRLRQIIVQYLWFSERVKKKDLQVCKDAGQDNLADLMTKRALAEVMLKHSRTLDLEFLDGRAELAPTLSGDTRGSRDSEMEA